MLILSSVPSNCAPRVLLVIIPVALAPVSRTARLRTFMSTEKRGLNDQGKVVFLSKRHKRDMKLALQALACAIAEAASGQGWGQVGSGVAKCCGRAAKDEVQLAATEEKVVVGNPVAGVGLAVEGGALDVLRGEERRG